MREKHKLTSKQQKFVDNYSGNATEAARLAGYKKPRVQGSENLTKPAIRAAIEARESEAKSNAIATREERQQFWTQVMYGQIKDQAIGKDGKIVEVPATLQNRLKASELLGRSQVDFVERRIVEDDNKITINVKREIIRRGGDDA